MISWIWSDWNIFLPFLIFHVFLIFGWDWFWLLSKGVGVPSVVVWRWTWKVILLVVSWIRSFWTFVWPVWSWVLKRTGLWWAFKWSWNWMRILVPVVHGGINVCWISSIIETGALSQMIWHHGQLLWMRHHPWVECHWWHLHMHRILKLLLIKWIKSWSLLQHRLFFWFFSTLLSFFLKI